MNTPTSSRRSAGFTLIEMIGVLAIVAILAAVMAPRVFSTIANSRVTSAVSSVNSISSAVTDFVGKYGPVPLASGNSRVDDLLLTSGYLDSRFTVKIGTQPSTPPVAGATWAFANSVWAASGGSSQTSQARIICSTATTTIPSSASGSNYQLDGSANLPTGAQVISAVIPNVTSAQALALSQAIDGETLSATAAGVADAAGKVVYAAPNGAGLTTVYIYIAQQ